MPRIQLTDEEFRIIEQRRLMENRENLGYNQCIIDVLAYLGDHGNDDLNAMFKWLNEQRKVIRP